MPITAREGTQPDAANDGEEATLQSLMDSPLYQVRRILRTTQMHWDLPVARGRKAARMARRAAARPAPLFAPLRPGTFAGLCTAAPAAASA